MGEGSKLEDVEVSGQAEMDRSIGIIHDPVVRVSSKSIVVIYFIRGIDYVCYTFYMNISIAGGGKGKVVQEVDNIQMCWICRFIIL